MKKALGKRIKVKKLADMIVQRIIVQRIKCDSCGKLKVKAERIMRGKGIIIIYYCTSCGHIKRAVVSCSCNLCNNEQSMC